MGLVFVFGWGMVDLKGLYRSVVNIVRLAVKPDWSEFSMLLKIVALGVSIVGIYGFIIQLLALGFYSIPLKNVPQGVVVGGVGAMLGVAVFIYFYGSRRGWW